MKNQIEWKPVKGSADPEINLVVDGVETNINIQNATSYGGGYCVNQNLFATEGCMIHCEFDKLADAKRDAVSKFNKQSNS